jgi:hypothetical protein
MFDPSEEVPAHIIQAKPGWAEGDYIRRVCRQKYNIPTVCQSPVLPFLAKKPSPLFAKTYDMHAT